MPTPAKRSTSVRRLHSRAVAEPGARSPEPETPPPTTPQEACARALELITRAWPDIIQAQIDKALKGGYQHAKYLGEYAGFSAALASPATAEEDSLAGFLLKQLQIREEGPEDAVREETPLL